MNVCDAALDGNVVTGEDKVVGIYTFHCKLFTFYNDLKEELSLLIPFHTPLPEKKKAHHFTTWCFIWVSFLDSFCLRENVAVCPIEVI